jgi:hypothetical protein
MRKYIGVLLTILLGSWSLTAMAQQGQLQIIGQGPMGPICAGPLGPGPCADIVRYLQQQQQGLPGPLVLPFPPGGGAGGAPGIAGLPGAGLLPQDGQIVAIIAQQCGGNPVCMAGAWGTVEV